MKRFFVLSLLAFSVTLCFAQTADTSNRTFAEKSIRSAIDPSKQARWMVDGKFLAGSAFDSIAKTINPKEVLEVNVYKPNEAVTRFGSIGASGVVVLITKSYATRQYQEKLGRFSSEYKKYLIANHSDRGIDYTLINANSKINMLDGKDSDPTMELYKLAEDKIKAVTFSVKETCCGVNWFCMIEVK